MHYTRLNQELDRSPLGRFARIMNWGYAGDETSSNSAVSVTATHINMYAAQLVTETIGAEILVGRDIIEVGCGRGGNLALLRSHYQPARLVGLDLCASSIDYCSRTYPSKAIEFVVGDAEELPFSEASFDGVLNVESAHSYPNLDRFFVEVARVLRPGGAFMIADMFIEDHHNELIGYLDSIGLTVEHDRDVTVNVLLSRAQAADRQLAALGQFADHDGIAQLWGGMHSTVRGMLADGILRYRTVTARRTCEPLPALKPATVDLAIFTTPSTIFSPFWIAG